MNINDILLSQNSITLAGLQSVASLQNSDNELFSMMATMFIEQYPEISANKVFIDTSTSIRLFGTYIYWDDSAEILLRLPHFFGQSQKGDYTITLFTDESFDIIGWAEENREHDNWKELLALCPECFQLEYIAKYYEKMPEDIVYSLFMDAYTNTDYGFGHIDKETIKRICVRRTDADRDATISKITHLPDLITVYRGTGDGSISVEDAYSWTTDINIAVFFATRRANNSATVYSGVVRKEDIIEFITDRNESEVFVLPNLVEDISPVISMREISNFHLTQEMLEWYGEYRYELKQLIKRQSFGTDLEAHDGLHMLRVLLYAIIIASEYPEIFDNYDAMTLLCKACITHDIGRTNDCVDDNHGAASYRIIDNESYFDATPELEFLLTYHCLSDAKAAKTEFYNDATTWMLYQILKDADALDRVRFGIRDLNVNMLRCPVSKTLILFAVQAINSIAL